MSSRKRKQERKISNNNSSPTFKPNKVKPKTRNQKELLKSVFINDITFCVGPAGTGKTHLSVGSAVDFLQRRKVERIVITRPMVEAGQKRNGNKSVIGYLPGDINAKMSPYLRPIHDELGKFITPDAMNLLKFNNTIEICPLEHMRGRTFENAFIIADEIQNATEEQIEMLLTRLGVGSTMIVVGDIDQTDLPDHLAGGFENFIDDLDGLKGLGIIYLETCDIARHPIVAAILERRAALDGPEPISLERIKYDGNSPKNASSKCQHDANPDHSLDGRLQADLQGNDLS